MYEESNGSWTKNPSLQVPSSRTPFFTALPFDLNSRGRQCLHNLKCVEIVMHGRLSRHWAVRMRLLIIYLPGTCIPSSFFQLLLTIKITHSYICGIFTKFGIYFYDKNNIQEGITRQVVMRTIYSCLNTLSVSWEYVTTDSEKNWSCMTSRYLLILYYFRQIWKYCCSLLCVTKGTKTYNSNKNLQQRQYLNEPLFICSFNLILRQDIRNLYCWLQPLLWGILCVGVWWQ